MTPRNAFGRIGLCVRLGLNLASTKHFLAYANYIEIAHRSVERRLFSHSEFVATVSHSEVRDRRQTAPLSVMMITASKNVLFE